MSNLNDLKTKAQNGNASDWYNYGAALSQAYMDDEAVTWLTKATNAGHGEAALDLQLLYASTGNEAKAEAILKDFVAKHSDPMPKIALGVLQFEKGASIDSIRLVAQGVKECEDAKIGIFPELKSQAVIALCSNTVATNEETAKWLNVGIKLIDTIEYDKLREYYPTLEQDMKALKRSGEERLAKLGSR